MMERTTSSERRAWCLIAGFSAAINILMLTGSLYMIQIYDRVLAGGSIPTLVGITGLVLVAYAVLGLLDHVRTTMLGRIGASIDARMALQVFRMTIGGQGPHAAGAGSRRLVSDLETIRNCVSGPGPTALLDLPFVPLFLGLCFLLHPALAAVAALAVGIVLALTWVTDRRSALHAAQLSASGDTERMAMENARRHSETILAMGLGPLVAAQHLALRTGLLQGICRLADATMGLGSLARTFRLVVQSAVLGLGAVLVIHGELSAGSMLAASVLASRALAPVELLLTHLKDLTAAFRSWQNIVAAMADAAQSGEAAMLAPAVDEAGAPGLQVLALSAAPSLQQPALVRDVQFALRPGEALALTGPSGSGKSSLLRALAGAWPLQSGQIVLRSGRRNPLAGYLPQEIELFPGTIAQNIARLAGDARPADILAAARAADAHAMIVNLPDGYETRVGEGGVQLSAGQTQRIGLARALFGEPDLVLFDEPDANLDGAGITALMETLEKLKRRNAIAIIATHGTELLARMDVIGRMTDGRLLGCQPASSSGSAPAPAFVAGPAPSSSAETLTPEAPPVRAVSVRALRQQYAASNASMAPR